MIKNKKGQTMGLAILSALAVFVCGFVFINFLMPEVTDFRANLSCASADTISDGTKLLCLVGDTVVIYWIWLVFSIVIGIIIARLNL
jgi:hypothetical protein